MARAPVTGAAALRESKAALRRRMLDARDALDPAVRAASSQALTARVVALPAYRDAGCILAYASFGSEFITDALLENVMASGRVLVLPRVHRDRRELELFRIRDIERELTPGTWGIREPGPDCREPCSPDAVEFVLVPGVAFTPQGKRLGYGGGYYDRLIRRFTRRPPLVAAAFQLQVVQEIPCGPTDEDIDSVLTDQG